MLSRRNIRIKVMQMLYSMSRDEKLTFNAALKRYNTSVNHAYLLYLLNLLQLVRVTEYALEVQKKKKAKLLPTAEDKLFTTKLAKNDLVQSLVHNRGFISLVKKHQLDERMNADNTRLLYIDFAKLPVYKDYLAQADSTEQDHKNILLALYKNCLNNELFNDIMEDNFSCWIDDKSLIMGAIKKTIKAFPTTDSFYEKFEPSPETTEEFGEVLFKSVIDNDATLLELIEPTLKNWDADRVAILDMILLKMALTELMGFPTIPTKVTLNEFVEVSKVYSTDKSKDFINGILDRLMKKLDTDGKINKSGRGLKG